MKKILSFLILSVLSVPLLGQAVVWQSQQNFEVQRLRALKSIGLAVRDTAGGVGFSNRDSVGTVIMGLDKKIYVKGEYGWQELSYSSGISVGLSAPSIFAVTGSPVVGSGTLALGFATGQTANQVLASPNGATGALALRSLVPEDMPALSGYALRNQATSAQVMNYWMQGTGRLEGALSISMGDFPAYALQVAPLSTSGGIAAQFTGRVIGTPAVNPNEYATLSQLGGFGSVSSVGLSAPSIFSVTGSPVTGSGTLALGFAAGQTANQVLASPDGTTGAVGLRALVASDIPALDVAKITTGIMPAARLGTGTPSNANFLRGDGVYSASLVGNFTVAGTLGSTTTAGNQFSSKYDASNTWNVSTFSTGITQITATGSAARTQFNQVVTGRAGFRLGLTNPGGSTDSILVKNSDSSMRCISPVIPIDRGGSGLTALGSALQQLRVNAAGTALEYFTDATPTLNAVTTAGNTTTNTVNVGGLVASGSAVLNGGLHLGIRTTTTSGAVSVSDYTVLVNNTTDVVLTLPTAASAPNSVFKIKKISTNSNTVTISPAGAEVIDAGTPLVFSTAWRAVEIQSNGTAWFVTGLGPL